MAVAAPRPCRHGGCRMLVTGRDGFCDAHRRESFKVQKQAVSIDYKERNRFYQRVIWKRLRSAQLQSEPLCRDCRKSGRLVAADVVDHVEPFESVDDPRAVDPGNLQSLCTPCHSSKTRRDRPGGGSKV